MAKATQKPKAKAATKVKSSAKKPIKKTVVQASTKNAKKGTINTQPRKITPIPKGWPVTSTSSYPPPIAVHNKQDIEANGSSEPSIHLKSGSLLRTNCNGSDVFLRKRAVQSASLAFPPADASKYKGPTRFLVVFPGRISLKPPEKSRVVEEAGHRTEDEINVEREDEPADNCIKKDDTEEIGEVKKSRNPFSPANPPQLLGKLISKGGPDRNMELRIPFPDNNLSASDDTNAKQLVFSGRAIPLDGKFMTLTFKRIGGTAKDSKNKMGTGSIVCKDIFRSAIVLGESRLHGVRGEVEEKKNEAVLRHYGGSVRTVDGGGDGVAVSRKNVSGRKDSKGKSTVSEKTMEDDESDLASNGDDGANDSEDASDLGSDDEFVPSKTRRKSGISEDGDAVVPERKRTPRRSAGKAINISYVDEDSDVDLDDGESESENKSDESQSEDDFDEQKEAKANKTTAPKTNAKRGRASTGRAASSKDAVVSKTKRTSRRSGEKAVNVTYEDEASDVDLDNDGSESEKNDCGESQSEVDEFDEMLDSSSKQSKPDAKPNAKNTTSPKTVVRRGRTSTGSATPFKDVKSIEEDRDDEVIVLDGDAGADKKKEASNKVNGSPKSTNKKKISTPGLGAKKGITAKATRAKKARPSSSLNSPISPHRRRKSPQKAPSSSVKNDDMNLSDDAFSFL